MQNMKIAGRRKDVTSTKLDISDDISLQREAEYHGLSKSALVRDILRGHIAAASKGRQGGQLPELLSGIATMYHKAKLALADGQLSAVEREGLTDNGVGVLSTIRRRRA